MRIYTVTGLLDEETGDLYVASVSLGAHEEVGSEHITYMEGYGDLLRFTGHFDADSAAEAEQIAVSVASSGPGEPLPEGRSRSRKHHHHQDRQAVIP